MFMIKYYTQVLFLEMYGNVCNFVHLCVQRCEFREWRLQELGLLSSSSSSSGLACVRLVYLSGDAIVSISCVSLQISVRAAVLGCDCLHFKRQFPLQVFLPVAVPPKSQVPSVLYFIADFYLICCCSGQYQLVFLWFVLFVPTQGTFSSEEYLVLITLLVYLCSRPNITVTGDQALKPISSYLCSNYYVQFFVS